MIEEVTRDDFTRILGKYGLSDEQIDNLESELCQLFEPKFNNALEADAHSWDTRELKPDRLLTQEEFEKVYEDSHTTVLTDNLLKAQDAKTASIKDAEWMKVLRNAVMQTGRDKNAECQERVKKVYQSVTEFMNKWGVFAHADYNNMREEWQALKKQEGVK